MVRLQWDGYVFLPSLRYELNAYLFGSGDHRLVEPRFLIHNQPSQRSYQNRQRWFPLGVADGYCESWQTMNALDHHHQ